jgi:hypothetical protein
MKRPSHTARPFRLYDGMALVAAIGCGIAWLRLVDVAHKHFMFVAMPEAEQAQWEADMGGPVPIPDTVWRSVVLIKEFSGMATALAGAFVYMRLTRPRPKRNRLFQSAGLAATSTILMVHVAIIGIRLPSPVEFFVGSASFPHGWWLIAAGVDAIVPTAIAIPLVWLQLALSGGLRFGGDWLDCIGLALGCYWIITAAIVLVV